MTDKLQISESTSHASEQVSNRLLRDALNSNASGTAADSLRVAQTSNHSAKAILGNCQIDGDLTTATQKSSLMDNSRFLNNLRQTEAETAAMQLQPNKLELPAPGSDTIPQKPVPKPVDTFLPNNTDRQIAPNAARPMESSTSATRNTP